VVGVSRPSRRHSGFSDAASHPEDGLDPSGWSGLGGPLLALSIKKEELDGKEL
jgi:hypothetical protein